MTTARVRPIRAKLSPTHARLARVLRTAPMMAWMSNQDGAAIFVNRKWLTFTGRSFDDELEDGWIESVHAEDRRLCLEEFRSALGSHRPFAIEYRLRRADGLYRWVCDVALPLYERNGAFAGYVGTCIDVTERREGTAALERTVEHLRLVAVNADEMIYRLRVGTPSYVEYVSPGVTRITGLAPEEFIAAQHAGLERVHPDDREKAKQLALAPPDPTSRVTVRWCHDDGRIVWAEHRRLPVYDREGNLVAIDGVARDITRQKELEQERNAQIKLLNGLIAHMNDGVLAETGDGELAVVNTAFRRMFNVPEDVTCSLRALVRQQLLNPDECCRSCHDDGGTPSTELRLQDGRIVEHEHFSVRLEDDREIHMWQFRDITTRKTEEEELRTSRHRLRDLSAHLEAAREEERRELARALHDEVGQLLTGIRLEISAAVQKFQDTRIRENFAVVDRLQAAVGLVDLSITTVQRMTTALRPPILDHLGLVAAIRWEAAVFERRTGIRCRVSSVPARLDTRAHITVLYRILLEALTNVARHANAGTVWIRVRKRPNRLTLEVRDNGRGISDEAIANPSTMGLLGMRERALAVGGEFRVTRIPTGGTSVVVNLPIDASTELADRSTPADA